MKKLLISLILGLWFNCFGLTLGWIPSIDLTVQGYYLVWGNSSNNYSNTNILVGASQNTLTIPDSNFLSGKIYYFNICAFDSNNVPGPYAGEVVYTNGVIPIFSVTTNGPPFPSISGNGGGFIPQPIPSPPKLLTITLSWHGQSNTLYNITSSKDLKHWTNLVTALMLTNYTYQTYDTVSFYRVGSTNFGYLNGKDINFKISFK